MKKTVRISAILWLLIACLLCSACAGMGGGTGGTTTSEETTTPEETTTSGRPIVTLATTEPEPNPEDMPKDELLLLNGVNVSSYRIVYAQSPLDKREGSSTFKTVREDIGEYLQGENKECDFDYQSAVRLRDLIKEAYGYELEIVEDNATKARQSRYEILVGDTNRQSSKKLTALADTPLLIDEYVCAMSTSTKANEKTQYVLCGGSYGATWHAIDEIEKFLKDNKGNTEAIDLSDVDKKDAYEFKYVACLGDSITRGSQGLPDGADYGGGNNGVSGKYGSAASKYLENYLSYPATLQRELWKEYQVYNYGRGWASMCDYFPNANDSGPYYYKDTAQFKNCLAASDEADFAFDVVLLMLGTNDAGSKDMTAPNDNSKKGASKWSSEFKEIFKNEAKTLIDELREGSPDAKFVLMNCPHRCDGHSENLNDSAIRTLQRNFAAELKAEGYDIYHYDMESYTARNLSKNGVCGSSLAEELEAHKGFYNIVHANKNGVYDTTHPCYVGYGLIAEGMMDLLSYLCESGEAPEYMINIG